MLAEASPSETMALTRFASLTLYWSDRIVVSVDTRFSSVDMVDAVLIYE